MYTEHLTHLCIMPVKEIHQVNPFAFFNLAAYNRTTKKAMRFFAHGLQNPSIFFLYGIESILAYILFGIIIRISWNIGAHRQHSIGIQTLLGKFA